jgi:hypothetical protein
MHRRTSLPLALAAAILLPVASVFALELSREIARMPAAERPTPAQREAARQTAARWAEYQQQLEQRLAPELQAWAARGKPYLPRTIFPNDLPQAAVPAFPGAEGAGEFSFGGRGGRVYVVTTLADGGPGSFREACEAAGPRLVVFNIAGVIRLQRPLHILAPYLTIAGQTAPGDGVCIAGFSTLVDTHDVVIRYLRFRRGATNLFDRDDCLGGQPIGNIIVDHCSASWGLDENLSMYRHLLRAPGTSEFLKLPTVNLTIQWCISSEALNTYNHAFGGTWGGDHTSFHHNLFACNTGRNPSIGMSYDFNFVNNVLFNWRHRTMDGGDQGSRVNCINNYYKPGPATLDTPVRYRIGLPQPSTFKPDPTRRYGRWYVAGNYVDGYPRITADNWAGGVQLSRGRTVETEAALPGSETRALLRQIRADQPFPMAPITLQTAAAAYASVLANAGATLPHRDPVDRRIIEEVRTGKVTFEKGIITDIRQVGGYPEYRGPPEADLGADGIPLWWKTKYGLDPHDPNLADRDLMGDGYTVIEKYLDGLDPTKKVDWADPRSNVNTLTLAALRPPPPLKPDAAPPPGN